MKLSHFKKNIFILTLLVIISLNNLFGKDLTFSCKKSGISSIAQGTYRCDFQGRLYYKNIHDEEEEILSLCEPNVHNPDLKTRDLRVCNGITELYGNNFYSFDDYGNLYFIATGSFYIWSGINTLERAVFLYKYNPVDKSLSNILINEYSIPNSFCISNDGKWAFLDTFNIYDSYKETGKSCIYAIETDFKTEPILIYNSKTISKDEHGIRNICFAPQTKKLYFYQIGEGLYSINQDDNGNYSSSNANLSKYTSIPPCAIYANNNGVWGVGEVPNSSNKSELFQIANADGIIFDDIITIKPKVDGFWKFNHKISVKSDFIIFLSEENSKIYKYDINNLKNISNLIPKKKEYSFEDLETAADIILRKMNVPVETKTLKNLLTIHASICAVLILVIFILIIYIITLTRKTNKIRKDKQFIFNIQEVERGKISRDIHDSIIQDIRAIRIETELLNVDTEGEARKNKVINLATDCVVKLRNICYNLTPAELATHNEGDSSKIELVSIIQSLVLQFIERTHVPCQLKIDENFDYPVLEKETSQNLFRIIQEALNNIEKHSYATNCQILIKNKIEDDQKHMLIYISDDGVGCDVGQITRRRKMHFGIHNMMDRADLIGAKLEFQSEPGQGLEIRIEI